MEKTFFIKTFGCKTNQIESQLIEQNLIQNGYKKASSITAQYYIINSCTVTSHTDNQTLSHINQIKKQNKNAKVVLTGCMSQVLDKKPKNVDIILGNDEKLDISNHLQKDSIRDIFTQKEFHHTFLKNATTTRPFIKIQEGCDNRCSYCIIPYARGAARSESIENIVEQINFLAEKGYKEVVLTGTHIGQWGKEEGKSLIDLLKKIEKTSIHRYRLGSLYVNEITDEILDILKNSKKFCPHFHLSLQSLCDKTLENMNRKYTSEYACELIQKLKKTFTLPFLGCDIIVGFPNETNEDFEKTYLNLLRSKLSQIHVFPYSKRTNTPAASMDGQVQEKIKKERVRKVMSLSKELHKDFLTENIGSEQEILFEKKSSKLDLNTGFSRNYIKVFVEDENDFKNTIKFVKLEASHFNKIL